MYRESILRWVLIVSIGLLLTVPASVASLGLSPSVSPVHPGGTPNFEPASAPRVAGNTTPPPPPGPGSIAVGENPDALALNPAAKRLYVANDGVGTGSGSLSIVNTSTNEVTGLISGLPDPEGLAFDPDNGYLFVPEFTPCCPSSVTVIDTATDAIVGSIPLGTYNPTSAVFDSRNGYVYVSDTNGQAVSVLNGANATLVATIPVASGGNPWALAFDSANGNIYVPNSGAQNVSVINGSTDRVSKWFAVPGNDPDAIAVDTSNGYLYVADSTCNACQGNVSVLNATDGEIVATIPVGTNPRSIAFDPANGKLYVTGMGGGNGTVGSGNLTVINGATDRVVGSLPVLERPVAVAFDPANGDLYAADEGSNAVSVVSADLATYPITISESGLPTGTGWYVQAAGGEFISVGPSVTFFEPNGTYPAVAASDNEFYVARSFGPIVVDGAAVALTANFETNSLLLTFEESGLPNGTYWVVGVRGVVQNGSFENRNSSTPEIQFRLLNGTYSYQVYAIGTYSPIPASGSVVMNGTPVTVFVSFATAYSVAFNESGLPAGTFWSVTLGLAEEGTNFYRIAFLEPDGSYPYTVGAIPGYTATPRAGTVVVDGASVQILVAFARVTYSVTFTERGPLPRGEGWSVVFNGSLESTTANSVSFRAPNGSYPYLLLAPPGMRVAGPPPAGSVTVIGSNVVVSLAFERGPTYSLTFSESGLPTGAQWCVAVEGWVDCSRVPAVSYRGLSPGTYAYAVLPKSGDIISAHEGYRAVPLSGNVSLAYPVQIELTYVHPYLVLFVESGLSNRTLGMPWSVTIAGSTGQSFGPVISFELPNGTYSYRIGPEPGYTVVSSPRNVRVDGGGVEVLVTFQPLQGRSGPFASAFLPALVAAPLPGVVLGRLRRRVRTPRW